MRTARPAAWAAAFTVVGTLLGAWLAARVPPGLPYDEPAHWSTVLFYAREHRMPVLGDPGVAYEAQMGPVYYALSGVLVGLVGTGDEPRAFYVLRFAGLCLIPVLAFLTYRLGRAVHRDPWVAVVATTLVAVNPLMLLIGASVQNDYLSFVLIAATVLVAVPVVRRGDSSAVLHVGLGALIGLAALTKVVAAALLPALLVVYVFHRASRRRRLLWAGSAVLGFLAVTGWWFVRNLLLYGDLTGGQGMARLGISFPPLRLHGLGDVVAWLSSIVGYVYAPVEYYRNVLKTPGVVRVAAVALALVTLVAVGLWVVSRRRALATLLSDRGDSGRLLLVAVPVVTVVAWVGYDLVVWNVPVRLAFHAATTLFVLLAVATRCRWGRVVRAANVVLFLAWNGWVAAAITGVPFQGLDLGP